MHFLRQVFHQRKIKGDNYGTKDIKKYALNVQGIIDIDDEGRITVSVEDRGEYDLAGLMDAFSGKECKISITYDEDYGVDVDNETGEVI